MAEPLNSISYITFYSLFANSLRKSRKYKITKKKFKEHFNEIFTLITVQCITTFINGNNFETINN